MSVARSRILELMKLQCSIFNTTFNPDRLRLGNKVLRQRLKGHILSKYYPPKVDVIQNLRKDYPDCLVPDEREELRLEAVEAKRARGKGAPKKRTAAESKKLTKRKPGAK
ncbi:uncharacterized protein PV09_00178 [Verruconis gallopava]|uniref:Small ribosomal subunit protein mS33 n=1 Tax=Verruconis gallopava TaxID=253628 RepID=A0A0D2ARU4_9PEZI|nr:uncharacterized protein PV09_00178 [Verruconis gallopava]KIW09255.1 hypothetical protein PV09_00178 [Verruconis gallopava]